MIDVEPALRYVPLRRTLPSPAAAVTSSKTCRRLPGAAARSPPSQHEQIGVAVVVVSRRRRPPGAAPPAARIELQRGVKRPASFAIAGAGRRARLDADRDRRRRRDRPATTPPGLARLAGCGGHRAAVGERHSRHGCRIDQVRLGAGRGDRLRVAPLFQIGLRVGDRVAAVAQRLERCPSPPRPSSAAPAAVSAVARP